MTGDRPVFRGERREGRGPAPAVLLVLAGVAGLAASRPLWAPAMPDGVAVEVRGDVPRPGVHLVHPPTLRAAVAAAGGDATAIGQGSLRAGDRVVVAGGVAHVEPGSDPLLVGLPIDLNRCDADALAAVPGLPRSTAEAIVAWRVAHGPFAGPADLDAVPGVGPAVAARLAPFVTYGPP